MLRKFSQIILNFTDIFLNFFHSSFGFIESLLTNSFKNKNIMSMFLLIYLEVFLFSNHMPLWAIKSLSNKIRCTFPTCTSFFRFFNPEKKLSTCLVFIWHKRFIFDTHCIFLFVILNFKSAHYSAVMITHQRNYKI